MGFTKMVSNLSLWLMALLAISIGWNANARLTFLSNDVAFQNATIQTLSSAQGFVAGVQYVQLLSSGVTFDFTTASSQGLGGAFGISDGLDSYFPEGVVVTFSQPLTSIGFHYALAECAGQVRFIGSAVTEQHTFQSGQGDIFVGATDIGDITSVELNGTCFAASWEEMRFDASTPPPPSPDEADLSMLTAAPFTASQLDGSIDFVLQTTNNGSDDATGVQKIDLPPPGMILNSSSPSAAVVSQDRKVIVMGVGDLANSDQYSNTLNMTVPPFQGSGAITTHSGNFQCNSRLFNIALATGTSIDLNSANNLDTSVTHFDKSSRFSVAELCDNAIDDNCDGRVDCGDNACSNAPRCRPPELLNANNNPPQTCTVIDSVLICLNDGGPVGFPGPGPAPVPPPPQSCTLYDVHGGPIGAPACCCSYGECDRAACENLKSRDPNFKTSNPAVSAQGYGITQAGRQHDYTITYENIGDADAINVRIFDVLAAELDDTTLQINNGGVYDDSQRLITWSDALLPPQEPRNVTFSINVNANALPGDRIRNQATILFPNAEQQRTDTNWVEHAIEDPNFPAAPDLGVVECNKLDASTDQWQVVLFNKGTAFAHNANAVALNPPEGISFSDSNTRFGRSDDTDPLVIGTVVPLGSTYSIDTVSFTADTPADVCKALTWRISYTTSEGEQLATDVQVAADSDGDGVADYDDNCPSEANLNQQDTDENGTGDACQIAEPPVCGDLDNDADVDTDDKSLFVAALRTQIGDAGFNSVADYDEDDDIDFADYRSWYECYRTYILQ